MSDFYDETSVPRPPASSTLTEPVSIPESGVTSDAPAPSEARIDPPENPAEKRFETCRWRETQDDAAPYCSNRDVLPYAGRNGFTPEAWCPDCKLYKVKRIVRKRSGENWDDY